MAVEMLNLDMWVAKTLAEKLREFRDCNAGYPSNYANADAWNAKLLSIIVPLEAYASKFEYSYDEELAATRATQQALRDLADILPQLWI